MERQETIVSGRPFCHPDPVRLRCQATGWVNDEPFPGLIEVAFTDAGGTRRSFVDKVSVFDAFDSLGPDTSYPVPIAIDCRPVDPLTATDAHGLVTVELLYGVADERFVVHRSSLTGQP